jgi:ABC-2 type transport system permease protein
LGKLIPFWVLGNVVFKIGLLVARIAYGIVPVGNLLLLYGFLWIFLLAVLGLGLLVSTYFETQQQAMFLMFFLMMIFILMGGLFTPINSMPGWAQWISAFNPLAYFIDVLRMIVLKGSGWRDILPHIGKILSFALVLNTWAIWNYRKSG